MDTNKISLRKVKLEEVRGLHRIAEIYSPIFNALFLNDEISAISLDALKSFMTLHPVQLSEQNGQFFVIGGFRSFQLAVALLPLSEKIPAFLHRDHSDDDVKRLIESDILVSRVAHSLGTKSSDQLKRLVEDLGKETCEKLIPGISSRRGLNRINRG